MRDYAKVGPQFWHGKTGKALKKQGAEAVIVAMYLMTCQHANMLGLYYLSKTYIAVDTGLGFEGACKGLAGACEAGFCQFDEDSEVVWVMEMAVFQIDAALDVKDNRCKGVQREYDALPENPYLAPFYERYGAAFHMTSCRGKVEKKARATKAPSKALRSQEQEQEHEHEQEQKQEDSFAVFWSAYPRKVDKQEAEKAFRKIEPDAQLLDAMLHAIKAQGLVHRFTSGEGQFVPHPTTWINKRRWESAPEPAARVNGHANGHGHSRKDIQLETAALMTGAGRRQPMQEVIDVTPATIAS